MRRFDVDTLLSVVAFFCLFSRTAVSQENPLEAYDSCKLSDGLHSEQSETHKLRSSDSVFSYFSPALNCVHGPAFMSLRIGFR